MQELKIVIEVFHMVFGAIYQDHFFKFKNFYFSLHPIMQCNEQPTVNGLVEIVFAEVAGLQLYRLKIRISCSLEFSAVYF